MRSDDIIKNSDSRSKYRAKNQSLHARLYKVEGNKILYTVSSSTGTRQYLVEILLLGLTGSRLKSLKSALNGDIKISCTCDAFLYQGYKYITYKKQVGINKETRPPNKTNPNQVGMACKHIIVALSQFKNDYSKIYDLFKLQQSNQPKQTSSDYKNNYKSQSITDIDAQIISDFKSSCDKLYKDYIKFIQSSNDNDSRTFVDSQLYDGNDPSRLLLNLSKPLRKSIQGRFIGKCKSIESILSLIDQKKNGFNIMIDSDVQSLLKKINNDISIKTESLINSMILSMI